jgi:hypothetical protein
MNLNFLPFIICLGIIIACAIGLYNLPESNLPQGLDKYSIEVICNSHQTLATHPCRRWLIKIQEARP